ncbi:MAG: type II toxin-antitoxin system RelE/ParE family toxin [Desulfobaccales bacterium]|nr:type II toxin-antitoxin system RelE/ParE family toxin [Desulfobaccales bacterium]
MIKSFRCKETKKLFNRQPIKRIPQNLQRAALRKLLILDAAESLEDLKSPAGNKLEALKGDRQGQHSIRINEQFRLGFIWQGNDAHEVEIVDYY